MAEEQINYERDTKLDYDALDVEWWRQADLARQYAKHLKNVRSECRRLEEKKKVVRSELIDKINRNPKHYTAKDKPNATDIEAAYRRQEEYKDVVEELLDKQEELDYAELVYKEIAITRKYSLEWLGKFWLGEYFAGPSMPRNLAEEIKSFAEKQKERRKEANKAIKMNRNDKKQE